MRRLTLPLIMLTLCACQDEQSSEGENVEALATTAFLAAVERQSGAFVPDLDPGSFPLGEGQALSFEELIRLRKIDGRFLGDFKLQKDGRRLEFSVWFERNASQWQISGWEPVIRPLKDENVRSKHPTEVPPSLAAPSLRRAPAPRWAHVLASHRGRGPQDPAHRWAQVTPSILSAQGCSRSRLKRKLRRSSPDITACVHRYVAKRTKGSRILLNLTAENQGQPALTLRESTLPNDPLVQCLRRTLSKTLGPQKTSCIATLRIMIRPEQKRSVPQSR